LAVLEGGGVPIHEPGLEELMHRNREAGRLRFTGDTAAAVAGVEVAILCVGTPPTGFGNADLSYVFPAAEAVAKAASDHLVLTTKSTVPVGTGAKVREIVRRVRPDLQIDVASNPEFLREGAAIRDFMRPDRILIGTSSPEAEAVLKAMYAPLRDKHPCTLYNTSVETAELTKYAANAFLAAKLAFINEMADLCERTGANIRELVPAMGHDRRIGFDFLETGPGYGGSCFPKDTAALVYSAREAGMRLSIVEASIESNQHRKEAMADRVKAIMGGVTGKTIAILGLAFKADTDDMREAASLEIVSRLAASGAKIRAYDPAAMPNARGLLLDHLNRIEFCASDEEAVTGADATVVITEWGQFRNLHLRGMREKMVGQLVIDLRNIYHPDTMREAGFRYHPLGSTPV
jgi:UDPglucose 6-dehydrogenase